MLNLMMHDSTRTTARKICGPCILQAHSERDVEPHNHRKTTVHATHREGPAAEVARVGSTQPERMMQPDCHVKMAVFARFPEYEVLVRAHIAGIQTECVTKPNG